jgi:UrcA family protein
MNTPRPFRLIGLLLAAAAAAGLSGLAHAGDTDNDVPKQVVKFADLNVNSPAGAAALYRRIQRAAQQVCRDPLDIRELSMAVRAKSCNAEAIERAVKAVNAQMLTSLHLAKTGRTEMPIILAKRP